MNLPTKRTLSLLLIKQIEDFSEKFFNDVNGTLQNVYTRKNLKCLYAMSIVEVVKEVFKQLRFESLQGTPW